MLRALKILGWTLGIALVLVLGAAAALFFSENAQWVPLSWPYPRLSFDEPFGLHTFEVMVGVAAAGWLVAFACLLAALVLLPLYLRRARQYHSTIKRLEKELVALRNLPFQAPAPLEDLPDEPVHDEDPDDDEDRDPFREEEPELERELKLKPQTGATPR